MSKESSVEKVELLIGVIFRDSMLLGSLEDSLEVSFGPVELRSDIYDFDVTDYYEPEMGKGLKRIFYSFRNLIVPDEIVGIKLRTNRLEDEFALDGKRRVNIDPGYIDFYKLVLVSNKFLGQKIYLGKGVYADPTLYYDKGWKPYVWGFPDFKSGRYYDFLERVREVYKQKIRRQRW